MNKTKSIVASYVGTAFFSLFIFISAWKLLYWQAILYFILSVIGTTLNHLVMPKNSTLTEERISKTEEGLEWDKKLLKLYFLVSLASFVVAGLDSGRFYWSKGLPVAVNVAGAIAMVVGQIVFAFAKRENAFFSSTVRIQNDKGHKVCNTGLYGFVRHPGYLGMIVSMLAFPLVMGSLYSGIPALICVAIMIARTILEDNFLKENLAGYEDYAKKTKWKLIPAVI